MNAKRTRLFPRHLRVSMLRRSAGAAPAGRRGNFFVLVVGTLALLSVIAVAYVTVGRSDRRLSAAATQQADIDRVRDTVRDYLLGVIAQDVFAPYDELGWTAPTAAQETTDRLETWDAPYTRSDRWSIKRRPPGARPGVREESFVPWGDGDDPWLAATVPTNLGLLNVSPTADQLDDLALDWEQISNFAPDGRFVNLFNLRGNFRQPPGRDGMSQRLTLFEVTDPEQAPRPTDRLPFLPTETANRDIPAHWTMFQAGAFGPITGDPRVLPDDPDYVPYQWADTDGDGMRDARWFELVDTSEDMGREAEYLLAPQDGIRWFVAARAIDLSGLLNVNTATDLANVPTTVEGAIRTPIGGTPADVDRVRLLGMEDIASTYQNAVGDPLSYADIPHSPSLGENPDEVPNNDYRAYTPLEARRIGDAATVNFGLRLGAWGYNPGTNPATDAELDVPSDQIADITGFLPETGGDAGRVDDARERAEWYTQKAGNASGVVFDPIAGNYNATARFSSGDLAELLTFGGLNDARVTSTLESVLSVPGDFVGVLPLATTPERAGRPYSPLRADRDLAAERRVDVITGAGSPLTGMDDPDGVADDPYQALVASDLRRYITTISGARPLVSRPFQVTNTLGVPPPEELSRAITPSDIALSLPDLLNGDPTAEERTLLFDTIYDTLVPFADQPSAWAGDPDFAQTRFRNYGYASAELGLRLSAHLAANLIDSFDTDAEPTVFTVAISDQGEMDLDANALSGFAGRADDWKWARWDQPDARLNDDTDDTVAGGVSVDRPQAPDMGSGTAEPMSRHINVYGVEPQPLITEVAAFYWYTDAPYGIHDDEGRDPSAGPGALPWNYRIELISSNPADPFAPAEAVAVWDPASVTIDGAVDRGNPDYITSVLVVQLHNPFDEDIQLSAISPDGYGPYYLEFAGRFYKLSEINWTDLIESDLTLPAGESRNFYIIGDRPNDPANVDPNLDPEDRLSRILDDTNETLQQPNDPSSPAFAPASPIEGRIRDWIQNQASITLGATTPVVAIPQFNPSTDDIITDLSMQDPFLLATTGEPEPNQVVMLWRAYRDPTGEPPGSNNDIRNDILVDRLRDPNYGTTDVTLDARLAGGGELDIGLGGPDWSFFKNVVEGDPNLEPTDGFWGEGLDPSTSTGANSGATIVTWASIRRPSDLDGAVANAAPPLGAWPAFGIERKFGLGPDIPGFMMPDAAWDDADRNDRVTLSGIPYGSLAFDPDFLTRANEGLRPTLDEFVFDQVDGGFAVHTTIIADAEAKPGVIGRNIPDPMGMNAPFTELRSEAFPRQRDAATAPVDTGSTDAVVRIGDLLSTLSIGPWYDPSYDPTRGVDFSTTPRTAASLNALSSAWTTLPEAMALALGYEERSAIDSTIGPATPDVFANLAGPTANDPSARRKLDRGHLVIDDFVPYVQARNLADGIFNAGNLNSGTIDSTGLPTDFDQPVGLGIPIAQELMDRFRGTPAAAAGTNRLIPGLINVNTAPLPVLRTLPLLSPRINDPSFAEVEFWDTGVLENLTGPNGIGTDIASAIIAYRSMAPFALNGVVAIDENPSLAQPNALLTGPAMDFSEQNGWILAAPGAPNYGATPWSYAARVPGLREDNSISDRADLGVVAMEAPRGFRSLGELLNVRYEDPAGNTSLHNITKLAENAGADAQSEWARVLIEGRAYPRTAPTDSDGIENDYDERLAIFNAISNIATVRSDTYAVWFILHGYREADVTGLADEDPMVPSIRRRYLMILDRSNVTQPGEMPRVLEFRTVPY